MCTVTYIPSPDAVYITSNRDESPGRHATRLTSQHTPADTTIHFPLDEQSGGSWIAMNDRGRIACLLNGAFESFIPKPGYRMSRGLVVTDAAHSDDLDQFLRRYELEGIAPFTLLIYEEGRFEEMIWDGNEKFIRQPDLNTPQIWSSVTLYPETIRQKRKQLFETWLRTHPSYNREDIISFHHLSHGDAENDFIMNRNEIVKTLSITSIMTNASALSMLHISLDPSRREEILVASE